MSVCVCVFFKNKSVLYWKKIVTLEEDTFGWSLPNRYNSYVLKLLEDIEIIWKY